MGFTCIVLESLLGSQESYIWYFIAVGAFGVCAWLLFLTGFPLDMSLETKENDAANEGDYQKAQENNKVKDYHNEPTSEKSAEKPLLGRTNSM
jgi:hypothetical protein